MSILFTKYEHTLEPRQVISGTAGQAQTIGVEYGELWLTIEGDPADYWLSAGDSMLLQPHRLVVVEAHDESRLWLQPAACHHDHDEPALAAASFNCDSQEKRSASGDCGP